MGSRRMTALYYAAYRGDQNELAWQVDAGADPNAKDELEAIPQRTRWPFWRQQVARVFLTPSSIP